MNNKDTDAISPGHPSALSDAELIDGIADGNAALLGEIYVRYNRRIKAALLNFAPEMSAADAEDVSQEVFMAIGDSASRYQEQSKFAAWLFGIAQRKAANWRRRTFVRRRFSLKNSEPVAIAFKTDNDSPANQASLRQMVAQSLSNLPMHQREVLWLHFVEGFDGDEIAKILNIQKDTVYTRMFRARKKLLEQVDKDVVLAALREEQK
ncbi:MAG: RNA polymerase sigma factor [Deltaproteobacteria bacterium]|nr:RNA polymerase sigma factor [Deltaproteobacteria bacterium]